MKFLLFQVFCKTVKDINTLMFSIIVSISATGEETFFAKSSSPFFLVTKQEPNTCYTVKVWASNRHGKSDPNYITMTTLNVPDIAERKLKNSESDKSLAWLCIFIGLSMTVILFIITVMSLKYCRKEGVLTRESETHTMYHEIDNNRDNTEVTENDGVTYHQIGEDKSKELNMEGLEKDISRYKNVGIGRTKPLDQVILCTRISGPYGRGTNKKIHTHTD